MWNSWNIPLLFFHVRRKLCNINKWLNMFETLERKQTNGKEECK